MTTRLAPTAVVINTGKILIRSDIYKTHWRSPALPRLRIEKASACSAAAAVAPKLILRLIVFALNKTLTKAVFSR